MGSLRVADLFDGNLHRLTPGEDFTWPVDKVVIGFEEAEEEEPLGPYESPALVPILSPTPYLHGAWLKEPADREKHQIGQGWGSFSVAMSTVVHMTGGQKHQFQWPKYGKSPDEFTFQFQAHDTGWQGGLL